MIVRIIPFLFNIDQIGISLGHICFPSVPPFPQKHQQNESLPEVIMVGRDRDRFFAVSFLNKGGQLNTCLQKLSKKCRLNAVWMFQNAKSWCCFTELHARPPFRWVVFKARSREISTRSKCPWSLKPLADVSMLDAPQFFKIPQFSKKQTFQSLVRLFVSESWLRHL